MPMKTDKSLLLLLPNINSKVGLWGTRIAVVPNVYISKRSHCKWIREISQSFHWCRGIFFVSIQNKMYNSKVREFILRTLFLKLPPSDIINFFYSTKYSHHPSDLLTLFFAPIHFIIERHMSSTKCQMSTCEIFLIFWNY